MTTAIADAGLDQIFRQARSHSYWQGKPLTDTLIEAVYELAKWGPTSANCSPARFVFVKSDEAKERLKPFLIPTNVHKVMDSAATVIIAQDMEFYEKIPHLFPHNPGAREWFAGNDEAIATTAFRNSSLQGAYFMIAARALGIDCGPMSGFDNAGVDKEFFSGTAWKSNFICAIGYGDESHIHDRSPRLSFGDACQIL